MGGAVIGLDIKGRAAGSRSSDRVTEADDEEESDWPELDGPWPFEG